ncbi:MAG: ABC transporter substrate-binding protein [Niameybacter sp.]|uniref:ABC transporter substrate-binding protein n=1 Tax=Niameybacter sp. TaxID=2033640 RepID=UPI002FC77F22
MKLKKLACLSLAALMTVGTLAGCGGNKDVFLERAEAGIFKTTASYDPPETLHANVWASSGMGTIAGFAHERLFDYIPLPEKTYIPVLGESFTEEGNTLTMKIREGVLWSDGTPFTSQDVIAYFDIAFMTNQLVWTYLDDVKATGDYTLEFTFPTTNAITTQLVTNIVMNTPYHIYKEWADQAATLRAESKRGDDGKWDHADERQALKENLFEFKPDALTLVGTGPFLPTNITSSQSILKKNASYWGAETIKFNEIHLERFTNLESYLNLIMAEGYDYETQGMSPDVYQQVLKENPEMRVILAADLGQPSLQFNMRVAPIDNVLVRQAVQHVVDRDSLMLIAEPGSEAADLTSSGMVPPMRDTYLSEEFLSTLTVYNGDKDKAEELLIQNGWSRNADNKWVDETGKLVKLEMATASAYPTFFLCADAIVNQLNEFGLTATLKAMDTSAYWKYLGDGDAMMSVGMRPGSPNYGEPWEIYRSFFIDGAADMGFVAPEEKKAGLTNVIMTLPDGSTVDTGAILTELLNTEDDARKVELTEEFASMLNELASFMPLVTKYIPNKIYNPYLTGFPTDQNDIIWFGADSTRIMCRLMREGKLYYDTTAKAE